MCLLLNSKRQERFHKIIKPYCSNNQDINLKRYRISADILDREYLCEDLSKKSGFDIEFINEYCLTHPLETVTEQIKKEHDVTSDKGRYTILADDLSSVFRNVKSLSTIRIPHKDFCFLPVGIAIYVEEFEKDESNNLKKQKSWDPNPVNSDLIQIFKKYEITHNSPTLDTFIVYAPEFHEELKKSERHLFSTEISFNNQKFFLGDLSVMQDTEGIISNNKISIEKFKQRIQLHGFWNYFEIKALLFKPAERDVWNVQFIYVRLLEEASNVLEGIKTDHLLLLHHLYDISQLNDLLRQITTGDKIKIGQITASIELIKNRIKFEFYQRSHPFASSFGVDYPCYALSKFGANSDQLKAVQVRLTSELRNLSRPFEDIRDAVARALGLGFLAGAYSPFIVVLAPMLMDIIHIEMDEDKIHVRLDCSPAIKLDGLRLSLYGRDNQDKQTGLHESITEFSREGDSTTVYSNYYLREEDKQSVSVKFVIYYREHPLYEKHISRPSR